MLLLIVAVLIIVATFSTKIAARFGVPMLLLFIASGILFGDDVLGLIKFDDAVLARDIANICLMVILFEGGFLLRWRTIRRALWPSISLATLGVFVTALAIAASLYFLFGVPPLVAFLIGAIISSTDAAAVMMAMREQSVSERVSATLQVESASNDPMAILLTTATVGIAEKSVSAEGGGIAAAEIGALALSLCWQFAGGVALGVLVFYVGRWLFNKLASENQGYYYVLTVGVCLLSYGLAGALSANGVIAVFTTGVMLGNSRFAYKRGVGHFINGISTCSNIAVFLLLGLLVFPRNFLDVSILARGVCVALITIFVARPVAVFVATAFFGFSIREKLFLTWGGIKGAVAIVLATYPAVAGLDPREEIFNIVFLAVLFSCVLQGTSIGRLARKLRLTVPSKPASPFKIELMTAKDSDLDMFEMHIGEAPTGKNKRIRDLRLPPDTVIACVVRDGKLIVPGGSTELLQGDTVYVLAHVANIQDIANELNGQSFDTRIYNRKDMERTEAAALPQVNALGIAQQAELQMTGDEADEAQAGADPNPRDDRQAPA